MMLNHLCRFCRFFGIRILYRALAFALPFASSSSATKAASHELGRLPYIDEQSYIVVTENINDTDGPCNQECAQWQLCLS